jgi:dienelactone hydrolase
MIRRSLIVLIVAALATGCASNSYTGGEAPDSTTRTRYSGNEAGTTPVGAIPDITLTDTSRNRDVVLSIDYPTRGGPHPLIVFSPAAGLGNRSYVGLSSYWAANDYVVFRLSHTNDRPQDVRFVLDSIDTLVQRYPELQGRIDSTRIGIAGHADGAETALRFAGDSRVKGVVALAPADTTSSADVRIPALFITAAPTVSAAEAAAVPPVTPPKAAAFTSAPAGDKWLITIENARFAAFTGRLDDLIAQQAREQTEAVRNPIGTGATVAPDGRLITRADHAAMRLQDMFAVVRGSALAFWDAYLKTGTGGKEALERATGRRGVTVESK